MITFAQEPSLLSPLAAVLFHIVIQLFMGGRLMLAYKRPLSPFQSMSAPSASFRSQLTNPQHCPAWQTRLSINSTRRCGIQRHAQSAYEGEPLGRQAKIGSALSIGDRRSARTLKRSDLLAIHCLDSFKSTSFLGAVVHMARPAPGTKRSATKPRPKAGTMAALGHAFKSAGSDVAATRGLDQKVSKAAKYSYLIGKELVGLVQVIPYGVHAMLTHSSLPLGKGLQQDLVGGLGQVGQGLGLNVTEGSKAGRSGGERLQVLESEEGTMVGGGKADEIGSAIDLYPRNGAGDATSVSSGGVHLAGERVGWTEWAFGSFRKSVYSANVVKDLRYGDKERET